MCVVCADPGTHTWDPATLIRAVVVDAVRFLACFVLSGCCSMFPVLVAIDSGTGTHNYIIFGHWSIKGHLYTSVTHLLLEWSRHPLLKFRLGALCHPKYFISTRSTARDYSIANCCIMVPCHGDRQVHVVLLLASFPQGLGDS